MFTLQVDQVIFENQLVAGRVLDGIIKIGDKLSFCKTINSSLDGPGLVLEYHLQERVCQLEVQGILFYGRSVEQVEEGMTCGIRLSDGLSEIKELISRIEPDCSICIGKT